MRITTKDTRHGARALVNGKLLSVTQTAKFNYFMETSPRFRERFMQLSLTPDTEK
jgi:hypothetical protein